MPESVVGSVKPIKQRDEQGLRHWLAGAAEKLRHLAPARQFMLVSSVVLILGMFSSGWWLGSQIEARVIDNTVSTNAVYIESFVAPLLQDIGGKTAMQDAKIATLNSILQGTPLGEEIVALIVWGPDGHVLYSSEPTQIGRVYPVTEDLEASFHGEVTWELNRQNDQPHIPPQNRSSLLLATYAPVRLAGTQQIIGVAEFYQAGDPLERDIALAQRRTWMIVAVVTLAMYLALAGFIRRASNTIVRQQSELGAQVKRLTELLTQNAELHERVRRATHRAATLNERYLRRISAELHDGPAQYLGLSLLHLDRVAAYHETHAEQPQMRDHVEAVQNSLTQALREVRAVSAGLGLPQLDGRTLEGVVTHVVKAHERQTKTQVELDLGELPEQASLSVKITLYRVIQEGLSNAYRHAGGVGQRVHVWTDADQLLIEVADKGPGFQRPATVEVEERLGLSGMRERVESLGGRFSIASQPGQGTLVRSSIPLRETNDDEA